ncbi:MBL fold metallo-hydrolase [Thermosipho atlanticus]|uniref:Glyoxylase, beta-lactamase superfamily II n=1 Tax=Thermosipho atlanticus DSM 15807 TaxID=1123380 RepID=A0A1M5TW92_9BACT|nr:MBL fold metallo-hydrolase [Thermosipho atlanticus]SHH55057.1 Glyoxylase, beta-lactamase superfamily II [Thermosipho atlanticus DSM 15807]
MNFKLIKTSGFLATNTYIFEKDGITYVVDPGYGIGNYLKDKPVIALLTHGHFDHIAGLPELNLIDVYISDEDKEMLYDAEKNFSYLFGQKFIFEGDTKNIDELFDTIKAPGHTLGSRIVIHGNLIFTGDTIFCSTIGRSDLGGSKKLMNETIKKLNKKFLEFLEDMLILPGHENICKVSELFKINPFFKRGIV